MFGYSSVIAEAYTQVDKDFSKMRKERRINLAFVLRIEQRHHLPANLRVVLPTGPRNERREDKDGLIAVWTTKLGLVVALSVGLNRSSSAVIKHYALRLILWSPTRNFDLR